MIRIAVVGAGAAGCFCAIELKRRLPHSSVEIFERSSRPLHKLTLTGGGKCNITNSFEGVDILKAYPRGGRLMRHLFKRFSHRDTFDWFARIGVPVVVNADGRAFPESMDATDVAGKLLRELERLGVTIHTDSGISDIADLSGYDGIVVTSGGNTAGMLALSGVEVEREVPSLFSFRISGLSSLMGVSCESVRLRIPGTGFESIGPLLFTDWGVSGPSVLRLSSYAARHLAEVSYKFEMQVRWLQFSEDELRNWFAETCVQSPNKNVLNAHPEGIASRLWEFLCKRSGLRKDIVYGELGKIGINHLVSTLLADSYKVDGKCRFKEEFVTCGGVSLNAVNPDTLESVVRPSLFFAGEVLDIDAVTGGFNLQAAWTTAFVAASACALKYS